MCPGSHSSATFSTTCSFSAWSSPSHDFHLFWGFFLTFPVWHENSNTPNSSLLLGQEAFSASTHSGRCPWCGKQVHTVLP